MFETAFVSPTRPTRPPALADLLLLRPVAAPGPGEVWSPRERTVLLAVRGGWARVQALAWTWNPDGPVLWRCAVDLGGMVGWYAYDVRLVRPAPGP